jgi:hypothetical protein
MYPEMQQNLIYQSRLVEGDIPGRQADALVSISFNPLGSGLPADPFGLDNFLLLCKQDAMYIAFQRNSDSLVFKVLVDRIDLIDVKGSQISLICQDQLMLRSSICFGSVRFPCPCSFPFALGSRVCSGYASGTLATFL